MVDKEPVTFNDIQAEVRCQGTLDSFGALVGSVEDFAVKRTK